MSPLFTGIQAVSGFPAFEGLLTGAADSTATHILLFALSLSLLLLLCWHFLLLASLPMLASCSCWRPCCFLFLYCCNHPYCCYVYLLPYCCIHHCCGRHSYSWCCIHPCCCRQSCCCIHACCCRHSLFCIIPAVTSANILRLGRRVNSDPDRINGLRN